MGDGAGVGGAHESGGPPLGTRQDPARAGIRAVSWKTADSPFGKEFPVHAARRNALVALAAKEHGAPLATRDARARGTYDAVGVTVIAVT